MTCSLPASANTAPNTYSAALAALEAGSHPLQRAVAPDEPAPSAESAPSAEPTALQRERALRLRAEAALDAAETRERQLRRKLQRRSKRAKVRPKR